MLLNSRHSLTFITLNKSVPIGIHFNYETRRNLNIRELLIFKINSRTFEYLLKVNEIVNNFKLRREKRDSTLNSENKL